MEILWCTKAPRADIYSQFVFALRTTAGCVKRRSRRAGPMCPAAKYALLPAGHAGPALQGAAVAWGGQGRSPLHVLCGTSYPKGICSAALHCRTPSPTHLVIASQSADWRGNPFPARQRRADGTSGTPSPTHLVIASQSVDWRGNPFPQRSPPLTNRLGWV